MPKGALTTKNSFFFGTSTGEERDEDLAFIAQARAHISDGQTVYYTSWW